MIRLSELKVVENAFFKNELSYNKSSLYPFIEKNFIEDKSYDDATIKKIGEILEKTKDKLAHNVLLNKDIDIIKKKIYKKDLEFDEIYWTSKLHLIHKKIEKNLGLKFKLKEIQFCDSFPKEYQNYELRGASAITVFEGFEKSGIYYLKKRVDNTSTVIHIIHEQIHACLSQNKDKNQIFIEWFEEGIAILYSSLIFYELTKDIETLNAYKVRSFIFSKTKPEWDFTKRYFEYAKIISKIFLAGGFDLLNNLIKAYLNNKREKINSYLDTIQNNELQIKYLPKNKIENLIANFSNIIEPEQITPLEYSIVECLNKPKKIEDISKEINAPIEITRNVLNRLFGKGICIVVRDGNIDINWRKKDLFDKHLIKPIFPL